MIRVVTFQVAFRVESETLDAALPDEADTEPDQEKSLARHYHERPLQR